MIAIGVLEYTFFGPGFISLIMSVRESGGGEQGNAPAVSNHSLPYSEVTFVRWSCKRSTENLEWKNRLVFFGRKSRAVYVEE